MDEEPPDLTKDQVVQIVRRVVCRSDFYAKGRCQEYFRALDYDLETVIELLAECTTAELVKHELDDEYPTRPYYIAEFDIDVEGDSGPLYVKVALRLPELESGYLLSFKPRT